MQHDVDHESWFRRVDDRLPELLSAPAGEFEEVLRTMLQELETSHIAFYHEVPTVFPAQHTINATLTPVVDSGSEAWMFLDVFPEGPAATAGVKPGDLLFQVDHVDQSPPTMPSFAVGRTQTLTIRTSGRKWQSRAYGSDSGCEGFKAAAPDRRTEEHHPFSSPTRRWPTKGCVLSRSVRGAVLGDAGAKRLQS